MNTVTLRPWQRAAFDLFRTSDGPDFLAVATPGAGKTTFALACARLQLAEWAAAGDRRKLVVVAPTSHLKIQWSLAAHRLGLQLDPDWAPDRGIARDVHGIVTTYQQVAMGVASEKLRGLANDGMVILDEIHHAGHEKAWGDGVRNAFATAARRLSLSGTPFRSDSARIPFVRYDVTAEGDLAHSDYTYGYAEALRDGGVVRPVYFPRVDGEMEWSTPSGDVLRANFSDELASNQVSARLRTALSLDGDWLGTVLGQAHDRLQLIRREQPEAGGLIIAIDQDHAQGIARLLRNRLNTTADVVVSDDPGASARIAEFATNDRPWLVAVRMVSEGVDIPRLRVGVYATTTSTELFFRQAVGRFVRWTPGVRDQKAYLFIPDDPRLRARAFQIADQRRHSLRKRTQERFERDPAALDTGNEEQMSLFAALSAVATEQATHTPFESADNVDDDHDLDLDDDPSLVMNLAPPPPLANETGDRRFVDDARNALGDEKTRSEEKKRLREKNAELVALLVKRSGQSHAQVNAELNRLSGVGRISEATVGQLQKRLDVAVKLAKT